MTVNGLWAEKFDEPADSRIRAVQAGCPFTVICTRSG